MADEQREETGQGEFFAIDRRSWAKACALGLNEAVAYLVLACFSQRDNTTTAASVHAVETYTGIARGRAGAAIEGLIGRGLVRRLRDGTRPLYALIPFADAQRARENTELLEHERTIVERIRTGDELNGRSERGYARSLAERGWLEERAGRFFAAGIAGPEWIWLPNTMVTGAASEAPPVELLRQTRDVMTLRLFVDFYFAQNLREDGGISRRILWRRYERERLGERAQYTVWGFRRPGTWVDWNSPVTKPHRREPTPEEKAANKTPAVDFFARLTVLETLHLVDWVPYLFEGDDAPAEPMFPCGLLGGDGIEDRIGLAVYRAGTSLLTPQQAAWTQGEGYWPVPVAKHIAKAQMFGIARLRYRPRTKLTAAWYAELQAALERWVPTFEAIAAGKVDAARAAG